MKTLKGVSVFSGVAIGPLHYYKRETQAVERREIQDPQAEIARFEAARQEAIQKLGELHDKTLADVGEANAAIFEIHQMMLDDQDYIDSVHGIITAQNVARYLKQFEREMRDAARDLEFEKAAALRDRIKQLREQFLIA